MPPAVRGERRDAVLLRGRHALLATRLQPPRRLSSSSRTCGSTRRIPDPDGAHFKALADAIDALCAQYVGLQSDELLLWIEKHVGALAPEPAPPADEDNAPAGGAPPESDGAAASSNEGQ